MNLEIAGLATQFHLQEWGDFRDEVRHHVGHKEGEEEPAGNVAIELTGLPKMTELHLPGEGIFGVEDEEDEEEVENIADGAPHHVGDEQPLRLVLQILLGVARHSLVEVARFEEKEGHEKISPLHDGCPPVFAAKATLIGDVKHYHTNDADATQEVEGVIAMFHVGY